MYSKIVFQDTDNMQKCINILYRVLRIRPKLMKNTMLNVDILNTVLDHFERSYYHQLIYIFLHLVRHLRTLA